MSEVGLTPRMLGALKFITEHVAQHGAMPSRGELADAMDCHKTHAARTIARMVERGAVHCYSAGGSLAGFGSAGVAVFVPADICARLARYCADNDERISAVMADAITLHLDLVASQSEVDRLVSQDDAAALAVAIEALGMPISPGGETAP